jgi:hypothetical protein
LIVLGVLRAELPATTLPASGQRAPAARRRARPPAGLRALAGRFALRQEGKNYPGRLHWRHDGDRDEWLLSSPLGQGLAEIVSDATGARLATSDGNSHTAATADQLLQSLLAYPLPLSKLLDWLRGCTIPTAATWHGTASAARYPCATRTGGSTTSTTATTRKPCPAASSSSMKAVLHCACASKSGRCCRLRCLPSCLRRLIP